MIGTRIFSGVLILASIFLAPYWIYVPMIFLAAIIFPLFWEGIVFTLLIDTIYGMGVSVFPPEASMLTVSMVALLLVMLPLRERIR